LVRVVVSGICGRMGTLVARSVVAEDGLRLVGGVEQPGHDQVGRRVCEAWGDGATDVRVAPGLDDFGKSDFDVIVDFSTPAQTVRCAEVASRFGKGLVVGTTGLTDLQMAIVHEAAQASPVVVAPNTSIAMNLMFGLVGRATSILGRDYDVEIVEVHHRNKKDAPSGTARQLVSTVSEARGAGPGQTASYGRSGLSSGRAEGEIGVHSLRAGAIVGRHEISFTSEVEELKLVHEAHSREAFALGALRAIRYVHGREPGLYDMLDVLGLAEERGT